MAIGGCHLFSVENELWAGNFALLNIEQNVIAQIVYDQYKPLFQFLSNDPWFKTQFVSPVPGAGAADSFSSVVPNGVVGGSANLADKADRWKWVSAPIVGIWASYEAWAPRHQAIQSADVTNLGIEIPPKLPSGPDISRLLNWSP
jgi:hypothetical protein